MDESWTSVRHAYMDTAKAAALSGMVGQISGCSKLFDNELKTWCLDKHGNNKNTNCYNFFDNIKNKAFPCKFIVGEFKKNIVPSVALKRIFNYKEPKPEFLNETTSRLFINIYSLFEKKYKNVSTTLIELNKDFDY